MHPETTSEMTCSDVSLKFLLFPQAVLDFTISELCEDLCTAKAYIYSGYTNPQTRNLKSMFLTKDLLALQQFLLVK